MGPRQWLYGQRSRSNPRSHSGSLHRPHVEDLNFKPRIDRAEGCAVPEAGAPTPGTHGPAGPRCARAPVGASRGLRTRLLRPARQVGHRDRPPTQRRSERGGGLRHDDALAAAFCTDRGNADQQIWRGWSASLNGMLRSACPAAKCWWRVGARRQSSVSRSSIPASAAIRRTSGDESRTRKPTPA
jgi:hypothetical protein